MSASLVLSWQEGVTAAAASDAALVAQVPGARVSFRDVPPVMLAALRRLDPPGEDEQQLADSVRAGDGSLAQWYYYLACLSKRGLLRQSACVNETVLASLEAVSPAFVATWQQPVPGKRYVLSRFAYLRRLDGDAVLESPLAQAQIIFNDCRAAALVVALATPKSMRELATLLGGIPEEAVVVLLTLLLRSEMVACATSVENESPSMKAWAFHDLLFHAYSRRGRRDAHDPTSQTTARIAPPSALKALPAGEVRALDRPDLSRLEREDPPLAHVQEQRRTIREFDDERPLTIRQLGEFLFRVGRVKEHWEAEITTEQGPVRMDFASRPYPSGGALYELEFYVAVNVCGDLEPGLFHYDAAGHRLTRLHGRTPLVINLLRDAAESSGINEESLQVLLILAARFPRVSWKYDALAYALTLKHVGVVLQNMYLVATAMGLAPCSVGGGDSDLFARATGISYYEETSVGEFLLGSRKPGFIQENAPVLR